MAIEKNIVDDKIEVVGDYKLIHVRTATVIIEDGVELTRSFHRKVLSPHEDIAGESAEIQGICNAVWTDEVKAAWTAFQAAQAAQAA
tara:strand:- start:641 stop:901 length:261 start_codon:yes stop_codon:yes gene_type:complete